MRLKVRVDSDKPGLWSWLMKWLTGSTPKAVEVPAEDPPVLPTVDHRWEEFEGENGTAWQVLGVGRCTRAADTGIESEYVFQALDNKKVIELRVVLPETLVEAWQRAGGVRMTESERLAAVKKRLARMLGEGGPDRGVVDELD